MLDAAPVLARLAAAEGPAPLPPAAGAGALATVGATAAAALAAAPPPRVVCVAERCCCGAATGVAMGAWGGRLAAGGMAGVVTGAGAWLMTLARVRAAVQTGGVTATGGRGTTGLACGATALGVAGWSDVLRSAAVWGGGDGLVVAGSGMSCGCVACTWAAAATGCTAAGAIAAGVAGGW